ncbi:hybrid sensor histidine kinase/response regulator [Gehongia tenuis]|uniref:Circadian input-output histidine kinase CikA n=1 Tax=Gehongia tenuis TaxID=2763655 RepID=A0A926D229_9FIRM|nr:response regulator [Gehongia tenuis]MBC8530318.1 response regulator [Gehongia tenuis]
MSDNKTQEKITDFKQYELDLYRASNIGGVYTVRMDDEFTLLYGNDLYFQIHEFEPEDLIGKSCGIFIHPEDLSHVHSVLSRAREDNIKSVQWEMRIITGKNNLKHLLVSGSFNSRAGEEVFDGYIADISRQKKMEADLRASEEKFRIATENSDVSFWTYDFAHNEIIQTQASKIRHGYQDVIKDVPNALIDSGYVRQDSAKLYQDMFEQLRNGAKTYSGNFWFRTKDNLGWWCEHIDYTNVFDENGTPVCAHAIGRDVTAIKLAEKRYKEEMEYSTATQSENLLAKVRSNISQNVVESYIAKDTVGIFKAGMTYTDTAEALAQTGFTVEEQDVIRTYLDLDRVLQAFEEGETTFNLDYQRKLHDGTVIWVNLTVKTYQNPDTKDVMSFMYTYDINENKIKDGIIQAVSTLEHDYIAYIELNTDRYKLYLGKEDSIEMPPAQGDDYFEMMQRVNRTAVAPEDVERAIADMTPDVMRKNLKNHKVFSSVYSAHDAKKSMRQKRIQYAYLDERNQRVVLTRSDVTDMLNQQKQQQDMLQAALIAAEQANSAKSDFLSRMSHEIRTPMNAIIGMSAIAAQSIGDDAQVADCISKIGISSRFLLSLINDILDMSRIESGKMLLKNEKIPFEEFLNGISAICHTQASAKNIDYENIVDPNVEDCYIGDAMKLQQVMINLLSNAVKFTPEKGRVSLSVRQMRKEKNDAVLRFVINDTGCGISEEFIPHLFEAFTQEHSGTTAMYGGTGLGLAICKNLVAMMDGHIDVRSIVGVGSEFTVEVKLGITEESKKRYRKKTHYNFSELKALVVDDDVTVCEHAVITLKEIGVRSEWVDSGKKAVDKVKKKWDCKEYYDLVLVDWKMPEMDGIETARQIRKIVGPDVTIIIMTANDWASIEHDAKLAGVNLLMSKPMFKSSLISAFEKAFNDKQNDKDTEIKEDFNFAGKRILLAEDHPLNVEVAKKLLERKGFIVDHAENGLRAMEMFTTTPVGYYDAILMDIRMPEMDGLQATHNIRRWRKADAKSIPIIAMTANAFDEDIHKSKAAGMNAHLAKPIDPKHMFQTLFDFIYGKENERDGFEKQTN